MSTKKSASTSASNPTPPTNRKSSGNGQPAKTAAKRALAASERTMSDIHIGEVAGEVWGLLAKSDGQTLSAIKKRVDAPADLVVAAVGWLAREDKLEFVIRGRTVKLTLKE